MRKLIIISVLVLVLSIVIVLPVEAAGNSIEQIGVGKNLFEGKSPEDVSNQLVILATVSVAVLFFVGINKFLKRKWFKKSIKRMQEYVSYINGDEDEIIRFFMERDYDLDDADSLQVDDIYDYYIYRELEYLRYKNLKYPIDEYEKHLKQSNTLLKFKNFDFKDLGDIIHETELCCNESLK